MRVTISKAIHEDWMSRMPEGQPYERIAAPGVHEINDEERKELIEDCIHQGNIGGDYVDPISRSLTNAYRSLHKQLTA